MVTTTVALGLTVATLVGFAAVGLYFSRGRVRSVEDLVSARDSTGPGGMTATLVASVMGVWILFSAPEAGAGFGVGAVVGYAVGEAVPMAVYARIGPRIRETMPEGHSLTEYAHARFGSTMYAFVLLVSALYMFVFLAAELTGIAGALAFVADVPAHQTALLVGGFVLLYTVYGGLRASIVTDTVQAVLVVPLLALAVLGTLVAIGPTAALEGAAASTPGVGDAGFASGVQFGLALVFAILGAELINQTWWQRVYAADGRETVGTGFRRASVLNGLIVLVAALLGVVAAGNAELVADPAAAGYNADVAFFVLVGSVAPEWVVLGVVLLALLLVMSSMDSLFSALASLATVDLPRLLADPSDRQLALGARLLTVAVAAGAIYVSLRATSVLRLFFLADLLGAAVAFPLVYGLYSRSLTGPGALLASLSGLAVGLAYFPDLRGYITSIPFVGPQLPAADPLYLTAFGGAFLVSTGLTLAAAALSSPTFDHDELDGEIGRLDRGDGPHATVDSEPRPDGGRTRDAVTGETTTVESTRGDERPGE